MNPKEINSTLAFFCAAHLEVFREVRERLGREDWESWKPEIARRLVAESLDFFDSPAKIRAGRKALTRGVNIFSQDLHPTLYGSAVNMMSAREQNIAFYNCFGEDKTKYIVDLTNRALNSLVPPRAKHLGAPSAIEQSAHGHAICTAGKPGNRPSE